MSLLDRIREANAHDFSGFRPFFVAGTRLGRVKHAFAEIIARWPEVFRVGDSRVTLAGRLDDSTCLPEIRTAAVHAVLRELRGEGLITGWRDEMYPVTRAWSEPPRFVMERAAIPYFGVRGFGVHLNGYVRDGGGMSMWIGRRSRSKPTSPGKLDQIAAGGQPAGIGLERNLVKECAEEAAILSSLAGRMTAVGAISYALETRVGYRPDLLYAFDLELPRDFHPVNTDGEVEEFYLWPMARVIETLDDTDEFKFNCALVAIDFAIRHGYVPPEHRDYVEILHGLQGGAGIDDW